MRWLLALPGRSSWTAGALGVSAALIFSAKSVHAQIPSYRTRILGVFSSATGDPIEGAEVIDALAKTKALTTKTGTVSLSFLPEGSTIVRVQRVGFEPQQLIVVISAADTVPVTVLLKALPTTLPTVVTKDSAPSYISPGLRAFEERRRTNVGGHFISEAQLRKSDNRTMTNVVRQLPGIRIDCARRYVPADPENNNINGHWPGECWAMSLRMNAGSKLVHAACEVIVYVDGVRATMNDLEKFQVKEYGAVEYYAGGASVPPEFNTRNSACGVLLFWTRER